MEKICETCGRTFSKRPKDSMDQWADRAYCSLPCSNATKKFTPPHLVFWRNTEKKGPDDCWPWHGTRDRYGYGRIVCLNSIQKAHRVSYEMANGPIQDGLLVMHSCDNPNCVNPAHLSVGTQKQNTYTARISAARVRTRRRIWAPERRTRARERGRVGFGIAAIGARQAAGGRAT